MSRKRLSRGAELIYEDTAMPEQFLPDVFQSQYSSGIWGCDPILLMILSFTIGPIAIAFVVLTLGALGRLLRGGDSHQSTTRLPENRFKVVQQPQTRAGLERLKKTGPDLNGNAVRQFRRRLGGGAPRTGERRLRRREGRTSTNQHTRHGRMIAPKAYKRAPALANSSWYKGLLLSRLAGPADNDGAFDLVVSRMREGTEPPPHVHSREDELFYVLSGQLRAYVGGEVFTLAAGECIFLPRGIPHALIVASDEVRLIALITPGGYVDAFNRLNAPAQRMEVPTDPDAVTYAKADVGETINVFKRYGVRMLTPEEILKTMPRYPR